MKVGASGHQEIPLAVRDYMKHRIKTLLVSMAPDLTGITSLAAGTDQYFAEIVLNIGGRLHVVLPCEGYEATFPELADTKRFRALLAQAHEVERLAFSAPSEEAFFAAGRRVVELSDLMIVAWDQQPAKGLGGTADIVRYASERGKPIENVWPEGVTR